MTRLATTALIALLVAAPARAGVLFELETVDMKASGGQADTMHALVGGTSLKINVTGPHGADADMVYRGDRREMMAIDHTDKTYVVIDEATIEEIGARLSGFEAQMREAMKDVPPEQRAMVEEMMKQRMPQMQAQPVMPVDEIRRTGESGEKSGYPCVKYQLYRDGKLSKDFWVTDWDNVEGGRDAMRAFEDMAGFMEDLRAALPSFAQDPNSGSHAYEHLDELGGFPIVTIEYGSDGSVDRESRLKSSRIEDVDASAFAAPAGYTQQQIMR